jgi:hypothetical protein
MGATLILNPERIEATGTQFEYELPPIAGFGQVKDVLFMAKIHKVKATASTQISIKLMHSPDGDRQVAKYHSTPIAASTVATEPAMLDGFTDTDTNEPIGEYLHPLVVVQNANAGHWAVVSLYIVNKPV